MDKIEVIKKMIEKMPGDALAWYLLGEEYFAMGAASEALQSYSESLKYCDDDLRIKIVERLSELPSLMQTPSATSSASKASAVETKDQEYSDEEHYDDGDDENDDGKEYTDQHKNVVAFKVLDGGRKGGSTTSQKSEQPSITFDDVGGLDALKDAITMKIIKPFVNPGLFEKFKKKSGGGILLFGPPGCGKTYIARATAGECRARFIAVHITDVLDPYLGVSEQNIKDIFSTARANRPCVLFFDELDAIGFNRAKSSSHLLRPIVDQLMIEMEGIDTNTDKLLMIGATNMPWDVDPAFKRPGRFDRVLFVPPPDEKARAIIFQLKLQGRPVEQLDCHALARKTELYSGADIENVVEVATEKVINEIMKSGVERPISMNDLLSAINETKPSTTDWLRTIKNYVKYANQGGLYDDVEKYLSRHKII